MRMFRAVVMAALMVGGALVPAAPAAAQAPARPVVVAEPATGLVDFQMIRVTGSGFEPYALLEIFECRGDAVDESGCDPDNAYFADADGDGNVSTDFPVDARIFDETGRESDCRRVPGGCKVGVGLLADFSISGFASLDFDPAVPLHPAVAMDVRPRRHLADQQTVVVRGSNLVSLFETFVYQCAAGVPRSAGTCDFSQDVRGVAGRNGRVTLRYAVAARLQPADGGPPIDCTARRGACVLELAMGFSNSPDRYARTPLAFGSPR
jgi:hypothetical protein